MFSDSQPVQLVQVLSKDCDNTWHNVVAWSGKDIADLNSIVKGAPVYVCGRLRLNRYTNPEGVEKQVYEIIASKVRILNEV